MFFQDWRKTIAFLTAIFLALLLLSWTNLVFNKQPFLAFIQNSVRELLAPIQQRLESSLVWLRESIATLRELGTLRSDNLRLRQQNEDLSQELLRLSGIEEEVTRLHDLLEYRAHQENYSFIPARIIGWPSAWSSRFMLNVGTSDGIAVDMPVATPRGLIGRIIQTTAHSAEMMTLLDELSGVGGRVQACGSLGIVRGLGSQNPYLMMVNLSLDADILPGDSVVTSGLGGGFPAGILIGTIFSVETDETGLHKNAMLQMAVDSYSLHEVLVIHQLETFLDLQEDPEAEGILP